MQVTRTVTNGLYLTLQSKAAYYRLMARMLIIVGIVLVALGLLWPVLSKLGLGRLPGDIVMERENVKFYAPITTSILLSIVISALLWIFQRL